MISRAKEEKRKLGANPFGYARAFTCNPTPEQVETLHALLGYTWGTVDPVVMDPFAGGGSIPFESLRYGFTTYASELNPVATAILTATLDYPARFGPQLPPLIAKYGKLLVDEVKKRLDPCFPITKGENIFVYIWARTVACPYTGKPIPLSPNWWLLKGSKPVVAEPLFNARGKEAQFRIVEGASCAHVNPDKGTIRRGDGISPWDHDQAVAGDYIKSEARAGRMGRQLYALGVKKSGGVTFRVPHAADVEGYLRACETTRRKIASWEKDGLLPTEPRTLGRADWGAVIYGLHRWADSFSPRQLLSLVTGVEVLRELADRIRSENDSMLARAIITYLGFAIDKAADYNSEMTRWHSGRAVVVNTFDRHDFAFKWSFAEFDAAHNLYPWVVSQVGDAVAGIGSLLDEHALRLFAKATGSPGTERLTINRSTAAELTDVKDGSGGCPGAC
jgi:adenine-specific DNA methylase